MKSRILFFIIFSLSFIQENLIAQEKTYAIVSVGFYNLENLFDTEDDPLIRDEEFTPEGSKVWDTEKYQFKLANMATVINQVGKDVNPAGIGILGVSEIENRKVLEDLANHELLADRDWQIIHYNSPDSRGIDVGLIYRPDLFTPLESRPLPLDISNSKGEKRTTRDILFVKGLMGADTFAIFVNHWPSRRGGEKATRRYRMDGAQICKEKIDSIRSKSPGVKAIIMGDLNDDPVSPSVKKVLKAAGKKDKVKSPGFYNPMYSFFRKGLGSNAYRDAWSLFDQIIITDNFLSTEANGWIYYKTEIYRKPFLLQRTGRFKGYPFRTFAGDNFLGGYSDHLPVVIHLVKEVKNGQ